MREDSFKSRLQSRLQKSGRARTSETTKTCASIFTAKMFLGKTKDALCLLRKKESDQPNLNLKRPY